MNRYQIVTTIALSLLLAGCSATKRSKTPEQTSTVPSEAPRPPKGKVILYPQGYEPGSEYIEPDTTVAPPPTPTFEIKHPELSFSAAQSEHVRIRGINPLPGSGRLVLDLDRMKSEFCFPHEGKLISNYGPRGRSMHTGVDIKAAPGDTIRAAFAGVVRMAKSYSGYGNVVVVQHYLGFETVYAHCSHLLVAVNDKVEAGTPIGLAGRTGRATTEHLHFEMRVAGEPIDPNKLLDVENLTLRSGRLIVEENEGRIIAFNNESQRDEIKKSEDSLVLAGQQARAAAQAAAVKAADQRPAAASSTSAAAQYYKVQKGDTLYAIARKYSTTVNRLCELNGIRETTLLQINQNLRVK